MAEIGKVGTVCRDAFDYLLGLPTRSIYSTVTTLANPEKEIVTGDLISQKAACWINQNIKQGQVDIAEVGIPKLRELFTSGGFQNLIDQLTRLAEKGGKGLPILAGRAGLIGAAILLGFKLISSENKQVESISRGWGNDLLNSEGFHKLRMACGFLTIGGAALTNLPLAVAGLVGAGAMSIYRYAVAGLNPVNNPDFGSWWNRWFFNLFNSYWRNVQ